MSSPERVYAIGDIHGCSRTFQALLDKIAFTSADLLYCVGDYVDRGPDAKGVIDLILDLRRQGYSIHTLRGNHEQIMLESDRGPAEKQHWVINGGAATLLSFGVESYSGLELQYKEFFEDTAHWFAWENYLLVHAGLNFKIDDPFKDTHAMLWTRETEVDMDWLDGRIVIHGHTPMQGDSILRQGPPRINLDGGCVYPYREGMGWLVAVELGSLKFSMVKNIDNY